MRHAVVMGCLSFWAGCSSGDVFVELPPIDGMGTMVLRSSDGTADRAFVFSLDENPVIKLPENTGGGEVDLEVLLYESSVEQLLFPEGELSTDPEGDPLDPSDAVYRARIDDADGTGWTRVSLRSPEIEAFRVPPRPCPAFTLRQPLELDSDKDTTFAVAYLGEALVGTHDGKLIKVGREGSEVIPLPEPGFIPGAAAVEDDGTVWLAQDGVQHETTEEIIEPGGFIWRGVLLPTPDLQLTTTGDGLQFHRFLVVETTSTGVELISLAKHGAVQRFDGQSWETLDTFQFTTGQSGRGALVKLAPREILAGKVTDNTLVQWKNGVTTRFSSAALDQDTVTALARIDALDTTVVGTQFGSIHAIDHENLQDESRNLRSLGDTGVSIDINAIAPFDDGFIFAGRLGFGGLYLSEGTFCVPLKRRPGRFWPIRPDLQDEVTQVVPPTVKFIIPLGEREFMLIGDRPRQQIGSLPVNILVID